MSRLSPEQVELLHHIELAQSGWADRVLDQMVLAASLEAQGEVSADSIRSTVVESVRTATSEQVQRSSQRLISAKKLVEIGPGRYCASQVARQEADERRASVVALEAQAAKCWLECVQAVAPSQANVLTWKWFCSKVLDPLVRTLGVRTYELLLVGAHVDDPAGTVARSLDAIPQEAKGDVLRVLEAFLGSRDSSVRGYVLRQLHGYMLSLAAGLPAGTLDAFQAGAKPVRLKLFLDTNFLFSILKLHDNPANEVAGELIDLLKSVKSKVEVDLYVTPLTVDEAKRTLGGYESRLRDVQLTSKLAEIASNIDGDLSGIALKFLEAAKASKRRITISDFLGPYLEDFLTVLRSHRIELYNENTDALSTTQPVIDDILEEQARANKTPQRRSKSYEALRHDVTLWHLVTKRRPPKVDAPLDAVYWIVTVDHRLLRFDHYKRRRDRGVVPACVHPAVLLQMLQLWLPRSPQLDAALLGGLRASLPHLFDAEAEEMTIRILRALSRYEDVDDIPESTVTAILMNKALRTKMHAEETIQRQAQLVRDEIVRVAREAKEELQQERRRSTLLNEELVRTSAAVSEASRHGETALREALNRATGLQAALDRERSASEETNQRVQALESALASEKADQAQRTATKAVRTSRTWFCASFLALAGVLIVGAVASTGTLQAYVGTWRGAVLATTFAAGSWLTAVVMVGRRLLATKEWTGFVAFAKMARWVRNTVWTILVGVGVNALYDSLKK